MPELPEIRALSERLDRALAGRRLSGFDLFGFSALKTVGRGPHELRDRELAEVSSTGKYLIFRFDAADLVLHLSQGGRVDVEEPPKRTKPRGAVARLRFDSGPSLLMKEFGTERKAALWVLEPGDLGPMAGLGPEPFSDDFEDLVLAGVDKRRLHTMLRDQKTVAGIGRGHADDILHRARLGPYDSLTSLGSDERRRLLDAVRTTLADALEQERERTGGLPPKLGDRFLIHRRHGQPCPRCGETMRRVSYESYEITYCPACQTGGKVLADRRLSRLLK